MAYYQTKETFLDAEPYYKGYEDGFEKVYSNECSLCQDTCAGCKNYKAYINTVNGKTHVYKGDYIVYDSTGRRNVVSQRLFEQLFHEL